MIEVALPTSTRPRQAKVTQVSSLPRVVVCMLAGGLVLVGIYIAYRVAQYRAVQSDLRLQISRYAAAGLPTSDDSQARLYLDSTDQSDSGAWAEVLNLAEYLERRGNDWHVPHDLAMVSVFSWDDIHPTMKQNTASWLTDAEPVIARTGQLPNPSKPIWQPIAFDGYKTLLPVTQASMYLTNLLSAECSFAIERRELDRAVEALKSHRKSISACDYNLCVMVASINQKRSDVQHRSILLSLQDTPWTIAQLSAINDTIAPRENLAVRWREAWQGELAMFCEELTIDDGDIAAFVTIDNGDDSFSQSPPSTTGVSAARVLDVYHSLLSIGDGGYDGLTTRAAQIFESLQQLPPTKSDWLTNYLSPVSRPKVGLTHLAKYADECVKSEALRRQAKIAVAIKLYQLQHGAWPPSLDELHGIDDEDLQPLTPMRLQYTVDPDGQRVRFQALEVTVNR